MARVSLEQLLQGTLLLRLSLGRTPVISALTPAMGPFREGDSSEVTIAFSSMVLPQK